MQPLLRVLRRRCDGLLRCHRSLEDALGATCARPAKATCSNCGVSAQLMCRETFAVLPVVPSSCAKPPAREPDWGSPGSNTQRIYAALRTFFCLGLPPNGGAPAAATAPPAGGMRERCIGLDVISPELVHRRPGPRGGQTSSSGQTQARPYRYRGSLQLWASENSLGTRSWPQILLPARFGCFENCSFRSPKYRLIASCAASTD